MIAKPDARIADPVCIDRKDAVARDQNGAARQNLTGAMRSRDITAKMRDQIEVACAIAQPIGLEARIETALGEGRGAMNVASQAIHDASLRARHPSRTRAQSSADHPKRKAQQEGLHGQDSRGPSHRRGRRFCRGAAGRDDAGSNGCRRHSV
jgi:citrate lyase beta subunit